MDENYTLAGKFTRLKRLVGGNREKTNFEDSFGMPMEEFYKVTMPNPSIRRILAEIEFSIRLSKECDCKFDKEIESSIDFLQNSMDKDGVLTKSACEDAEKLIMPLQSAAKDYELILAAHAHIDMNWMWGWQETVASTIATFQTMLKLMDEYKDFHFSQSQASVYKIIEDYAPEMKPQIEKRISEGRWEITASAWVETDKNMPTEASLLNHIYYTRKYLHEHWGIDPSSLDLDFSPDTFGHSANVAEIDNFSGVKYYYHCRGLDGDNALYRYRAPSGKEVLAYREQYWYNSAITPLPAIGLIDVAKRSGGLKTGLAVYGVGDHGGGPTRRDIERGIEMQDWPIFPRIRFGTFHDYFKAAQTVYEKLPVIDREMNYFSPGCYTTQSRIKMGNRHCEAALYDAQTNNALASVAVGCDYNEAQYESAWQNVLFTHFHDILTGSCVQESREHAMGLFAHSMAIAGTRSSLAMQAIANAIDTSAVKTDKDVSNTQSEGGGVGYGLDGFTGTPAVEHGNGLTRIIHLFNTSATEREHCCTVTIWDWTGDMREISVKTTSGEDVDFELLDSKLQTYWSHNFFRILIKKRISAFGYSTVVLSQQEPTEYKMYFQPESRNDHPYNDVILENEKLKAVFSFRNGEMISLFDKCAKEERLKPNCSGGLRLIKTDYNSSNGWQIGRYMDISPSFDTTKFTSISGKLRNGFTIEQKIGNSVIKTTVSLSKGADALTYDIEADWHEIPLNESPVPVLVYLLPLIDTDDFIYDVPCGVVHREKMEIDVPALQYAAAVYKKRTACIATDCKYGYRANKDGLISTLINSTHYPDLYPERGIHKIKLSIFVASNLPHELHEIAFATNHAIAYQSGSSHDGTLKPENSLLTLDCGTAVVSNITRKNGKTYVTIYETDSKDTNATLTLPNGATSASLVDSQGNELEKMLIKDNKATVKIAKNSIAIVSF